MSMGKVVADYFPSGVNVYVPACQMAVDATNGKVNRISLGTPIAADDDAVTGSATTLTTNVAVTVTTLGGVLGGDMDSPYGRNVTLKAAAAVGTGTTAVFTVDGFDYLGQPMIENISVAHASSTNAVAGKKAFKTIKSIASDGGGSASTYAKVGVGAILGLPYKTMKVLSEELDNVIDGTLGTLTAPVLTDPQTATTGDPKGTYTPHSTLTGSAEVTISAIHDNSVNSDNNGGLFGIKHYHS